MFAQLKSPTALGAPGTPGGLQRGLCTWSQGSVLATPVRQELRDCSNCANQTPTSAAKPGHLVAVESEQHMQELMVTGMEVSKQTKMGGWVKRVFYLGSNEHGVPKLIVEKAKTPAAEVTGREKGILLADVGSLQRVRCRGGAPAVRIVPHASGASGTAREFVLRFPASAKSRDILIERLSGLMRGMGLSVDVTG